MHAREYYIHARTRLGIWVEVFNISELDGMAWADGLTELRDRFTESGIQYLGLRTEAILMKGDFVAFGIGVWHMGIGY